MQEKSFPKQTRKVRILYAIIALAAFGIILSVAGFTFAATQEQHDSFCASCHTQPESTFYQNSIAAQPIDMASYHTTQKVNCIDCHSGAGVPGRISAELMGARNALLWYTGTAQQPAVMTFAISNENCLKCHGNVIQPQFTAKEQIAVPGGHSGDEGYGQFNHWHQFLSRWQATSATAGACTSCHTGHSTGTTAQAGFMVDQAVQQECDACHKVLRRGD